MTVADQAARLRQIVGNQGTESRAKPSSAPDQTRPGSRGRTTRRARVIAVSSGKGGVGKTNIAVNLAVRLSELGRAVALVDVDMGMANADVLCGMKTMHNLSHVIAGRRLSLAGISVTGPGGFQLIPGANGIGGLADLAEGVRDHLVRELQQLESSCDVLILDTSAGISRPVITFAALADAVLVVVTPEPTAIADAYSMIKSVLLAEPEATVVIVVNQCSSEDQGRRVFDRIAAVTRRFLNKEVQYAGIIPFDEAVRQAVQKRQPFAQFRPKCPASRAITRLSHLMDRHAGRELSTNISQRDGFFSRLVNWFPSRDR